MTALHTQFCIFQAKEILGKSCNAPRSLHSVNSYTMVIIFLHGKQDGTFEVSRYLLARNLSGTAPVAGFSLCQESSLRKACVFSPRWVCWEFISPRSSACLVCGRANLTQDGPFSPWVGNACSLWNQDKRGLELCVSKTEEGWKRKNQAKLWVSRSCQACDHVHCSAAEEPPGKVWRRAWPCWCKFRILSLVFWDGAHP